MSFTVFQAGTKLYGMDPRGSTVELTLPAGVSIDASLPARFTINKNYAVIVNSPSRPLTVDANLNVRLLCPDPPASKPVISGVTSGSLSGTFKVRQTYFVKDAFGNLISETDFSPDSDSVTIASKYLRAASLSTSNDAVSGARLYRTTDGTAVYFRWLELNSNTQTSIEDDLSDAGLSTFSAPALGTPPDLSLVTEFKGRLFGVSKKAVDDLRYSEISAMHAWPSDNVQPIPQAGTDNRGLTGFMRRRDALGFGRLNGLYQFTGTTDATFKITGISENAGILATDSVQVYKDTAFFVWYDGIYTWDNNGVQCVSDGKVRSWFTKNSTFNLSRLKNAFAVIDPFRKKYRVYLASAGSQIEDCWIEYDFLTGRFWGPHTSHAFNPSSAFAYMSADDRKVPLVGGTDGFCRLDRTKRMDDSDTAIDFDVVTSRDDQAMPLNHKYFGALSILTDPQDRGTLEVQSIAGDSATLRPQDLEPEIADLTQSSSRLGIVGTGTAMKLRIRAREAGVYVNIRGFEVAPISVIGRRK